MRRGAAPGLVLLAAACTPGFAVDVYNAGREEIVLVAVGPGGARREERLESGRSATLAGAMEWHVVGAEGDWAVELPHPGEAFASRTLWGLHSAAYRFQVAERCVFALGPDQQPPVRELAAQPPGYPVGPSGPCVAGEPSGS